MARTRVPITFNYNYDQIIGYADVIEGGSIRLTITDSSLIDVLQKDALMHLSVDLSPMEAVDGNADIRTIHE